MPNAYAITVDKVLAQNYYFHREFSGIETYRNLDPIYPNKTLLTYSQNVPVGVFEVGTGWVTKAIPKDITLSRGYNFLFSTWANTTAFGELLFKFYVFRNNVETYLFTSASCSLASSNMSYLSELVWQHRINETMIQVKKDDRLVLRLFVNVTRAGAFTVGYDCNEYPSYVNDPTWDLLVQEWDALTGWASAGTGTSEISPVGQLHNLETGVGGYILRYRDIGTLPDDYTIEFLMVADSYGTNGDGSLSHEFYDGVHRYELDVYSGKIKNPDSTTEISVTNTAGVWYLWRLLIDSSSHIMDVYRNGSFLGDLGGGLNYISSDGTISALEALGNTGSNVEGHEDYIYIATGLYPPSPPADTTPPTYSNITNNMTTSSTTFTSAFGETSIGDTLDSSFTNTITGSKFTPLLSGNITNITAYVGNGAGFPVSNFKYAVYRVSDGVLTGYTSAGTMAFGASYAWITLNITSGGFIISAIDYYLCVFSDNDIGSYSSAEASKGMSKSSTYPTLPDPLTSPSTTNKRWSIYASYNYSAYDGIAGQNYSFSSLWNDDVNMSKSLFYTNNTGSQVGTDITPTSWYNTTAFWANMTMTLNNTVGVLVTFYFWANDTSNNINQTATYVILVISGAHNWTQVVAWQLTLQGRQWISVNAWLLRLTGRQWASINVWQIVLTGRSWSTVNFWQIDLTGRSWATATAWQIILNGRQWSTIDIWLLQLGGKGWLPISIWNLFLLPLEEIAIVTPLSFWYQHWLLALGLGILVLGVLGEEEYRRKRKRG